MFPLLNQVYEMHLPMWTPKGWFRTALTLLCLISFVVKDITWLKVKREMVHVFPSSPACLLFPKESMALRMGCERLHVYDLYWSSHVLSWACLSFTLYMNFHRSAFNCVLLLLSCLMICCDPAFICYYSLLLFAKVYSRICVLEIEWSFSVCILFVTITVLFCL